MKELFDFLFKKENVILPLKIKIVLDYPINNEDLHVHNTLDLMDSKIIKLPDNLIIDGDLELYNCKKLIGLPKNLKIKGYLELEHSSINLLPDDLQVDDYIYVSSGKEDWFRRYFPKFADKIR